MKKIPFKKNFRLLFGGGVLLVLLASALSAGAQSNGVPGPADYAAFSRFIADRNIFDPNRFPRNSRTYVRPKNNNGVRPSRSTPAFTLVGTMSYQKGLFAFFDGNNADLRKVLPASGSIAGYTVTEVTLTGVKLESADKKETVQMKIGEMMRQEGNHWLPAGRNESSASAETTEDSSAAATDDSSPDAGSAAPSTGEANDTLKKLMQQREQDLK